MTGLWIFIILLSIALFIVYLDFRIAASRNYPWIDHQSNHILKWENKNYTEELDQIKEELFRYPHEEITIKAKDQIPLHGYLFLSSQSKQTVICFHGYRFNCFKEYAFLANSLLKHSFNVVLVDMRGHQKSGGRYITFGNKEQDDVACWIDYIINRFPDYRLYLHGTSMGASSVLLSSTHSLPFQVKAAAADCGYSSAWDMFELLHHRIFHFHVPGLLSLANLCFRVFAHTDLHQLDIASQLKHSKLPTLFIHGSQDRLVPMQMSKINYQACSSEKQLLIIDDADHGRSFKTDPDQYLKTMLDFFSQYH